MKKMCFVIAAFIFLSSCNNSSNNDEAKSNSADSIGLTNPSSIDTIKHPSGMDNSSVISTDTAAMNVQNSIKKADSLQKKRK